MASYVKGTARGSAALLEASESLDEYDEELNKMFSLDSVFTLPILESLPEAPDEVIAIAKKRS